MRAALIGFISLTLTSCTSVTKTPACNGTTMTETRLYFGMSIPHGKPVTTTKFDAFVRTQVVPRFAEGFTLLNASGQWLDTETHQPLSESSKLLIRLHNADAGQEAAISDIIAAYKAQFHQQSVLRTDALVCAAF